ncbi:MAG: hypothetical protein HY602_01875, partial [Parcubacteria group bacterium]|nr:hypothetical protein [Parcubacteria group bacterium]
LLIGSLSNDLYRVSYLTQRGSLTAAKKFWQQANRWIEDLDRAKVKPYIRKIISDVKNQPMRNVFTAESAEKYLMYSTLLQNYALHSS